MAVAWTCSGFFSAVFNTMQLRLHVSITVWRRDDSDLKQQLPWWFRFVFLTDTVTSLGLRVIDRLAPLFDVVGFSFVSDVSSPRLLPA